MKNRSTFLPLVLAISLPISTLSYGMNAAQGAQQNQTPDIMGTIRSVVDWLRNNPVPTSIGGGIAAFALYKLFASKKVTKQQAPKKKSPASAPQNAKLQQSIEQLVQHAARAGELFQANQLPPAYLYGKYCAMAKRSGFAGLPAELRKALANATLAYDLAFTGYDLQTKTKIGLQPAIQKAALQLQQAIQQALAHAGYREPQAKSSSSSMGQQGQEAQFGMGGLVQMFLNQFKANPMATISLILSTGYNLLAQLNGWWPHNDTRNQNNAGPAPAAQQSNPQPAAPEQPQQGQAQPAPQQQMPENNTHPAPNPNDLPGLGVD